MTAGLYVAPEAINKRAQATFAFQLLRGGKGQTHAFGLEAGYFALGSTEFDFVGPVFFVGDLQQDTVRFTGERSSVIISLMPTYSYRPRWLGVPLAAFLSVGAYLNRSHEESRITDLTGEVLSERSRTSTGVNFLSRVGLAATIPGVLVDAAPEIGLHAYGLGIPPDVTPLLGLYVGFRF